MRFGLSEELPQHPKAVDMLRFALRKLGPWLVALVITVYMSYALPSSLGKDLACFGTTVIGTCFSATCVILFSLLDGPHRHRPAYSAASGLPPAVVDRQLCRLRRTLSDPRMVASWACTWRIPWPFAQNVMAALSTGLFIIRFRRPIITLSVTSRCHAAPHPPRPER